MGGKLRAIPHYREALSLGIDPGLEAEAFAWLASSLFKTGSHTAATSSAHRALCLTQDPSNSKGSWSGS